MSTQRRPGEAWPGHQVAISEAQHDEAIDRARQQTDAYGHDTGYFELGREESSHLIGCLGEVIVRDFVRDLFTGHEPVDVRLSGLGDQLDVIVTVGDSLEFGLHVKTGQYDRWPSLDQPFGVHAGQRLEQTDSAICLVSLIRSNYRYARIEGYLPTTELAEARILQSGERFPGRNYYSQTANRLTCIKQYRRITRAALLALAT